MIARASALALLLVVPSTALAVPILTNAVQWTPGTSPCDGACSLEWALDQMTREGTIPQPVAQRILAGEAERVEGIARPGDIFPGMSYAVGGTPRWDGRTYQLADGDRHHVTDELHVTYGNYIYRVANIRTCGNWAPRPPVPTKDKMKDSWSVPIDRPQPTHTSYGGASYGGSGTWGGDHYIIHPPSTPRVPEPPITPSPIPLPGAIWAMLAGIGVLLGFKVKK